MTFSKLGLTPGVCAPLARLGYSTPTPIQSAAIPLALSGVDLVARAQTGTGKTAAFGLPMIERLMVRAAGKGRRAPRGLVLVPTRELALQVHGALQSYGSAVRLRVTHLLGGVAIGPQMRALHHGTDIVVATPGRLIDHMERGSIDLSAVEILTIDEADRMLDMGFLPALRRVLRALPRDRQTLLFSATIPAHVTGLADEFMRDPRRIDAPQSELAAPTIAHSVHPVAADRKRALLLHLLAEQHGGQALVFCKTKRGADRVGAQLSDAGHRTAVIHGNKSQGARNRSLADFKTGRAAILVATDIAARGLDIAQLPLVINFDLPMVAEDYVHRAGRTGRAGAMGRSVSFVTPSDRKMMREIERLLPSPAEQVAAAVVVDLSAHAGPAERGSDARQRGRRPRGGRGSDVDYRERRTRSARAPLTRSSIRSNVTTSPS